MNNLIISKEGILHALNFYGIKDELYINKCYECFNSLKSNNTLINAFNKVYKILFTYDLDRTEIKKMWSKKDVYELFNDNAPAFITNLLLLSGYAKHIDNISKYNLDNTQKEIHIKRVHDCLLNVTTQKDYTGIRISQMLWGAYFINMRIIEVGRLQYELCSFNPINESIKENCIKIHIPKGDRLYIDDVKKSLADSSSHINKYFNIQTPNYYCTSWLLSPELHEVITKDSNIYRFYELFEITKSNNSAISDILNFVFDLREYNDFTELIATTSLQKQLKQLLLDGKKLSLGIGKLKKPF